MVLSNHLLLLTKSEATTLTLKSKLKNSCNFLNFVIATEPVTTNSIFFIIILIIIKYFHNVKINIMNKPNFKIIISPSKTQSNKNPLPNNMERPSTIGMAKEIFSKIRPLTIEETKSMYSLSSPKKIEEVYKMHQEHGQKLYYAIEMFNGEVFKQLDLNAYDKK